jgi:integrase
VSTEVAKALQKFKNEVAAGRTGPSVSVAAYLTRWLDEVDVRYATKRGYRTIVEGHLIPALGAYRLEDVDVEVIEGYLRRQQLRGRLSQSTLVHHRAVLSAAFSEAVRRNLVATNPVRNTRKPKVPDVERPTLTADQVRHFLVSLNGHWLEPLLKLELATGLRSGEIRGLWWDDMAPDCSSVTVRHTLVRVRHSGWDHGQPKTRRSRRVVPVNDFACPALQAHRARWAAEATDVQAAVSPWWHRLVFLTPAGEPIHDNRLLRDTKALLRSAGLPEVRFHDLRHTFATLLLEGGTEMRVVMEALGHSTITLTANTYTHVSTRLVEEAARRLNEQVGG